MVKIGKVTVVVMRILDSEMLKMVMDTGKIVIDDEIMKCHTLREILIYLLEKVKDYLDDTINGLPEHKAEYEKGDHGFYYCNGCRHEAYWDTDYGQQLFDYCPYCGARMEKDYDGWKMELRKERV